MTKTTKFFLAALILVVFSCKKDNKGSDKFEMQQLGDIKPKSLGFNFNGDPLATFNGSVYEWSSTANAWNRIGTNILPGGSSNSFYNLSQDAQGRYYVYGCCPTSQVYTCSSASGNWDTIPRLRPDVMVPGVVLINSMGDVLVRSESPYKDSFYYHIKKVGSNSWQPVAAVKKSGDQRPQFFANTGILCYGSDGELETRALNTNTGMYEQLYDPAEPANIPLLVGNGVQLIREYMHLLPSGMIYIVKRNDLESVFGDLYQLDARSRPAKAVRITRFKAPEVEAGWQARFGPFVMGADDATIRTTMICSSYPQMHTSAAVCNKKGTELDLLQHPLPDNFSVYSNSQQQAFIWRPNAYLYKW